MDRIAENLGEAKVIDKISAELTAFLGTDARAVVAGLREGTPVILTGTMEGAHAQTPVTIKPPTGKMGLGNVFVSLALARQQLSQLGITEPTPSQIRSALIGGSITGGSGATAATTNLPGILAMRSQNMGWGQIAYTLNLKLGTAVAGLKTVNHHLVLQAASPTGSDIANTKGQSVGSSEGGVVTGSERVGTRSGDAYGISGGHDGEGYGKGDY